MMEDEKWIWIGDEEPEVLEIVLIWTTVCIRPTLGFFSGTDWRYFSVNENFWLKNEPHIKVLFWQPLPAPPKEIIEVSWKNKTFNNKCTCENDLNCIKEENGYGDIINYCCKCSATRYEKF